MEAFGRGPVVVVEEVDAQLLMRTSSLLYFLAPLLLALMATAKDAFGRGQIVEVVADQLLTNPSSSSLCPLAPPSLSLVAMAKDDAFGRGQIVVDHQLPRTSSFWASQPMPISSIFPYLSALSLLALVVAVMDAFGETWPHIFVVFQPPSTSFSSSYHHRFASLLLMLAMVKEFVSVQSSHLVIVDAVF